MYASIWKFEGDPEELLPAYDAMSAELNAAGPGVRLCLRAQDGIVVVDTCPSREIHEGFAVSERLREARERFGMPEPSRVDGYPVHAVLVNR
jgi:hypothetical protein